MKRSLLQFGAVLMLLACSVNSMAGAWTPRSAFGGGPRTAAVGFTIGSYGYITTGFDSANYKRSMYKYDPGIDGWTQVTSLGGATGSGLGRDMAICFVVSTNAYVGLGQGGSPYLYDFWQYSGPSDVWTQKANFPGGKRRGAVSFAINGKGYVTTGQDSLGYKSDTWEYNPTTNVWTQKANFPGSARRLAVGFAIGSKGYLGTGEDGTFKADFYEYDPGANLWTAKASFPGTPRYGASAMVINNKGYVGCGYDNTLQNRNDFWEYDPSLNSWSQKSSFFGTPRSNAVALSIGTLGYLGTGYDGVVRDDFWVFDPTQTGINDHDQKLDVGVYPNPVITDAHFTIVNDEHAKCDFKLVSLDGKTVQEESFSGNEFHFERNGLPSGVYLYNITSGHSSASGKLLLVN